MNLVLNYQKSAIRCQWSVALYFQLFSLWVGQMNQSFVWLCELCASTQAIYFKDADRAGDFGVWDVCHEVLSGAQGATSCEQIVDQEGFRAGRECIFLDLNRVCTVLQSVALLPAFAWQLAPLADGDEWQVELERKDRSKNESLGLKTDQMRVVA